jgi:very-short-patch-repair endonuclease
MRALWALDIDPHPNPLPLGEGSQRKTFFAKNNLLVMRNRLVNIARKLRRNQTEHEDKLWYWLRGKRFWDLKFRRQYPIDKYVVDFFCFDKKLIIELDGGQHNEEKHIERDKIRDKYLENQGYKILRFWNFEINENLDGVLERIAEACHITEKN